MPAPSNLSKLSNLVNNDLIKKDVYDKLVARVSNINIDTGKVITKSDYDADKTELENKSPDVSSFASRTVLSTVENKTPDISNLATKAALTIIENKIPDVSNLVKKATMILKLKILETNILLLLCLIN